MRQFAPHVWGNDKISIFHMKNAEFMKIYYKRLISQVDTSEVEDNSSKNNSRMKKLFVTCWYHEGWLLFLCSKYCCVFVVLFLVERWLVTLSVFVSMTTNPRKTKIQFFRFNFKESRFSGSFSVNYSCTKLAMDSYDEVHFVKDGREITTPDLDVTDSIRFVNEVDDDVGSPKQQQQSQQRAINSSRNEIADVWRLKI